MARKSVWIKKDMVKHHLDRTGYKIEQRLTRLHEGSKTSKTAPGTIDRLD